MAAARSATVLSGVVVSSEVGMVVAVMPSLLMTTQPMPASLVPVEVSRVSPTLPVPPVAAFTASRSEWEWPSMNTSMPLTAFSRSMERLPMDSLSMPRCPRQTMMPQPWDFRASTCFWAILNISCPAGKVTPLILPGWALVAVSGVSRPNTPILVPSGAVKILLSPKAVFPLYRVLAERMGNLAALESFTRLS